MKEKIWKTLAERRQTTEQEQDASAAKLTVLQQKAVEIAKGYEKLPMRDKIGIIAQSFGGTSGKIETSPCTGKWRGTSDISIKFDNGTSLFIGNHRTPQAKIVKIQNEYINSALVRYNPEIINATKEAAITALRARETKDNELAVQKGLKPYTLLNVEFNDGTDEKSSGHMGWYYVTLAVDGKICSHIETGLNYAISDGKISEMPTRENYFSAGALKESDVDYVFNNVGFSSTSDLYSLPISKEVRRSAEKTFTERLDINKNKIIDEITSVALEFIKNTNIEDLIDLEGSCANYDINDKYAVFMNFEPYECPNYGLWFTFYEKNSEDGWNIEEQDTADLTEDSIRYNLEILFNNYTVKECLNI